MKKITIAAFTVGTLLSYAPFTPFAHAAPDPSGKLCTLAPGGAMQGGPLVLGDDTNPNKLYTGSMTCAVQSGGNSLYSAADDCTTPPQTPTMGVASTAGPCVPVPATRPLYICTSVTIVGDPDPANNGTYNYDYPSSTWLKEPAPAVCNDLPYLPFGFLCGFASETDPTGEPNVQTGVMDGGPLVITDEYHTSPPSGSITCTIQVGANSTHAGTDAFTATGPTTPGVVVLPETQASYEATVDDNVYLCSQVNMEGGATLYYDSPSDPLEDGSWSTSPTARCSLATSVTTPGPDEFPFDVLCPLFDTLPEPLRTILLDTFC